MKCQRYRCHVNRVYMESVDLVSSLYLASTWPDSPLAFARLAGAAARLGMNRTTLNNRMRKLGITRPQPQYPPSQ